MDVARGERFENIPNTYPAVAWYRNTMPNCEYLCQANVYLWWGYCVYSGTCQKLSGLSKYEREFEYLTKSELENNDIKLSKLFQDSGFLARLGACFLGCNLSNLASTADTCQ